MHLTTFTVSDLAEWLQHRQLDVMFKCTVGHVWCVSVWGGGREKDNGIQTE